ncbi:hypothetical protein M3O57_11795 [Xanthomonas nasturtii]|uniref:Uncharacterized protein n=1 Tax=Xanthomonas nasturtii TaxID=1843581 RepID=A0A3E1KEZ4_9XANT|nr:hypothetical protein [Xanthomonas nasturtii]MCL1500290.1 hypothetical protein [Xanthomonas nasturtii]MCL1505325.1 hypothetical protein [Xanthomonas nasturtii]MCL1523070.1 hypothetical protein [Xanthomonas nasturtii]MCL1530973.1 hypothetical protein [Xanthomonas nasturtii]MCL1565798.1 hypothetical protein [Xanthomonas nasturtii]
MTRNQALIQAIEFDLRDFHQQRMAQRAGLQMGLLREEQCRPVPDLSRIGRIREAIVCMDAIARKTMGSAAAT